MRAFLLAAPILAGVLISNIVAAKAEPLARSTTAGAPIVDVQPRAKGFSPNSAANEAEQRKLSRFDAKQQKLDEALDKKLNTCGC